MLRALVAAQIDLVENQQLANLAGADAACSTSRTCSMRSSRNGSLASTTCSSKSASRASCKVERNAATNSCGSARTNPTVSANTTSPTPANFDPPHGGIERREQLVGDEAVRAGQRIEQRRLAGIGIADQRDRRHRHFAPHMAAGVALPVQFLQARAQSANAFGDQAPIGLQLGFARAAQPDAALLSLKVGPASDQARGQMRKLRQVPLAACPRNCAHAARRCLKSNRYDLILDDQ